MDRMGLLGALKTAAHHEEHRREYEQRREEQRRQEAERKTADHARIEAFRARGEQRRADVDTKTAERTAEAARRADAGLEPPKWIPLAWMLAGVVAVVLMWGMFGAWSLLALAAAFVVGFVHLGILVDRADKRLALLADDSSGRHAA